MVNFNSQINVNTAIKMAGLLVLGLFAIFKLTTTVRATADTLAEVQRINREDHEKFDKRLRPLEAAAIYDRGYNAAKEVIEATEAQ